MPRYFLEVSYKGNNYSGFQKQENANSIQQEVERAMEIFFREKFELTSSSRTDAGVHALQNFFHFDFDAAINRQSIYNINAILPPDIVLKNIHNVADDAHCRFDAVSREYRYYIYREKNAFIADRAYYFPYKMDIENLSAAASVIPLYTDFTSFSKRNTQVKTFNCSILKSEWLVEGDCLVYRVIANRFLRGMVRGLVGTMLHVGRGKSTVEQFREIINAHDCTLADFSVPGHGLFLVKVNYPDNYFKHDL
ncbi:MAG: tRNA pseudouridine(38-40) synthase TruA [Bacteroidetes bacterium]|nr:tRNA pseudouridine(38-40) synthase TruA [Bacteroidota bacterium]